MKFKIKTRFNDFTNSSCLYPHLRDLVHDCIVKRVSISRSLNEFALIVRFEERR